MSSPDYCKIGEFFHMNHVRHVLIMFVLRNGIHPETNARIFPTFLALFIDTTIYALSKINKIFAPVSERHIDRLLGLLSSTKGRRYFLSSLKLHLSLVNLLKKLSVTSS